MNLDIHRLLVAKGLSAEDILEIAETMAAPVKRSAGAERQARYRARKAGGDVTSDVTRDGNEVTDPALSRPPNENNSNPPTHTHPDVTTPRARKAGIFPMLDCTDPETWADFLTNRSKKRLPNTASAHRKLETDLTAMAVRTGWPPGRVFSTCVAKGWGAIYDPRDEENDRSNITHIRPSGQQGIDRRSSLARAIDEGLDFLG